MNFKKICFVALAAVATMTASAFPHHHYHHHHHGTGFAVGAGILGAGLLASAIYDATHPAPPVVVAPTPVVTPAPVVVQQPVVQQTVPPQRVWVEGHWQTEKDAAGNVIRNTWVDGYWQTVQ